MNEPKGLPLRRSRAGSLPKKDATSLGEQGGRVARSSSASQLRSSEHRSGLAIESALRLRQSSLQR
jgi:hypothetical protein